MALVHKFKAFTHKLCLGKNDDFFRLFAFSKDSYHMHRSGFGLGIDPHLSPENKLRAAFALILALEGKILFNINGVDMKRAKRGFSGFDEAYENDFITEWELYIILTTKPYLKISIFHNGKVEFKKTILWRSVRI